MNHHTLVHDDIMDGIGVIAIGVQLHLYVTAFWHVHGPLASEAPTYGHLTVWRHVADDGVDLTVGGAPLVAGGDAEVHDGEVDPLTWLHTY